MKLFFKILYSTDLNEIGYYPQTSLREGYNPNLPNSHWQVKPHEFSSFEPNYELELHKDAIPTNYLNGASSPIGPIVDGKLKMIFKEFSLPPHRVYPVKVFHIGKQLEYYCFHIINPLFDYIDKNQSTLKIEHSINEGNKVIVPFVSDLSMDILIKYYLKSVDYDLKPNKLVLKSSFPNYDLFNNKQFGNDLIISSKMKKALDKNEISGIEYKMIRYFE